MKKKIMFRNFDIVMNMLCGALQEGELGIKFLSQSGFQI